MNLYLWRKWLTDECTIGELYIDGVFECFTLEDKQRDFPDKIPKKTAIWEGIYRVILDYSPKYKRIMPHVIGVRLFSGIRIHTGNRADPDTEGCILLGQTHTVNEVLQSRLAFNQFFPKLQKALNGGEDCFLTISTAPPVNNVT